MLTSLEKKGLEKLMKLIDVEKACKEIDRFKGYLDEDMICRLKIAVKRLPIVEAIPIEWLEEICRASFRKWETENIQNGVQKGVEYAQIARLILNLIELWRKVNAE